MLNTSIYNLPILYISFPFFGAQLPESSIGKALRLLQERLSSKITIGSHVESNGLAVNGVESDGVVSDGYLLNGVGMGCNGLSHSGVESSGILISSSS